MGVTPKSSAVLILDDDAIARETIRTVACSAGFAAVTPGSIGQFHDQICELRPVCVILGLALTGADGLIVLRRLASCGYSGKVIIVSGLDLRVIAAAGQAARGFGLDLAGVLAKPLDAEALQRLLLSPAREVQDAVAVDESLTREELSHALNDGWIEPYYQPKLCARTGAVWGVEALARIRHPVRGVIAPSGFIDVAEKTELIGKLTLMMLERSLRWLRECPLADCRLALNISRSTTGSGFAQALHALCIKHGVPPERITLEITETARQISDIEILESLTRFRMQGFELSLDDFGVGYSSLVDLAWLPFSELKIDQSFVNQLGACGISQKICSGVVALAKAIGIEVTAEGVETPEASSFLSEIGCDRLQGYLFSRPLPGEAAYHWISQRSALNL